MPRWISKQGVRTYGKDLKPGMIVAIDHQTMRHKPWVLHSIELRGERWVMILRPVGELHDLSEFNVPMGMAQWTALTVLDDHYAVCVRCGELPPCSEVWSERIATETVARAARYEIEGICPACQKPVSRRQASHRFEENTMAIFGPPVTFHAKSSCAGSAVEYDADLAKKNGTEPTLSCAGQLVQHRDDAYECHNVTCPGTQVRHGNYARCYVLGPKCNRPECWAIEGRRTT